MQKKINLVHHHCNTSMNDNLNLYFKDIKKYKVLAKYEQLRIIELAKGGDQIARNSLINTNQRFVVAVAKRFANHQNLLDYINQGNIGLIKAIDTFDCHRGFLFTTYAVHSVYKEILYYMVRTEPSIFKTNNDKTYFQLKNIKNKFYVENGRMPSEDELLELINKQMEIFKITNEADLYDLKVESIDDDTELDETEDFSVKRGNILETLLSNENQYIEQEEKENKIIMCNKFLKLLSDRDQEVIKLLFGIEKPYCLSVEDTAIRCGLGVERVRQIRKNALRLFKKNIKALI